jgi:hypothetical protein
VTISWDKPYKQKYLSFIFGEWDKGDFKFFGFSMNPLGWSVNLWRFCVTYDNFGKVKK